MVALLTFPLIWVGGLVTTYQAGMAVPDWPNTYGYNLFLYPWQTWLFGPWDLFIEHGHRLLGATVGIFTIALCVVFWRCESRRWARWLGAVALVGVVSQGLLGGMRVLLDERVLARIHGSVGPAFFAFAVALTVLTSRRWRSSQDPVVSAGAGRLQNMAVITTVLAYMQLVVGAHLRHPSLMWAPSVFQSMVVFHLILAAALAVHAIGLVVRSTRLTECDRTIRRTCWLLATLIFAQIVLGGLTWLENYGWYMFTERYAFAASHVVQAQSQLQALITTAHVAMGSLILATCGALSLLCFRWLRRVPRSAARRATTNSLGSPLMPTLAVGVGA